jgi:hypothetical protein
MKPTQFAKMFLAVAVVIGSPKPAVSQLLFDDFSTGPYQKTLKSGSDTNFQSGAMIGGSRETTFVACVSPCSKYNPFNQPSSFQVRAKTTITPSALIFNEGYKSQAYLQVGYGFSTPLSLNLASGYDRLRVTFDGADETVNFNLIVWSTGGTLYSAIGCNLLGSLTPFSVDFPFVDFTPGGGTPGASFSDITNMELELSAAQGSMGGANYAITSFQAIPIGAPAANITCTGNFSGTASGR